MSYYKGPSGIYFRKILRTIIEAGKLKDHRVIDFGCGEGMLKRMLPHIINFDKDPALSDIQNWRAEKFDVLVANEVFYEFEPHQLHKLLREMRSTHPDVKLIVGISRQGFLNKLGARLLNPRAYESANLPPAQELSILKQYCDIESRRPIWTLCDVYVMRFKSPDRK